MMMMMEKTFSILIRIKNRAATGTGFLYELDGFEINLEEEKSFCEIFNRMISTGSPYDSKHSHMFVNQYSCTIFNMPYAICKSQYALCQIA